MAAGGGGGAARGSGSNVRKPSTDSGGASAGAAASGCGGLRLGGRGGTRAGERLEAGGSRGRRRRGRGGRRGLGRNRAVGRTPERLEPGRRRRRGGPAGAGGSGSGRGCRRLGRGRAALGRRRGRGLDAVERRGRQGLGDGRGAALQDAGLAAPARPEDPDDDPLERVPGRRGVGRPVLGRLGEHRLEPRGELGVEVRLDVARLGQRLVDVLQQHGDRRVRGVGDPPDEHLVRHHPDRVEVGRRTDALRHRLLRATCRPGCRPSCRWRWRSSSGPR